MQSQSQAVRPQALPCSVKAGGRMEAQDSDYSNASMTCSPVGDRGAEQEGRSCALTWSDLPEPLIEVVFQHLGRNSATNHLRDVFLASGVCKDWQATAHATLSEHLWQQHDGSSLITHPRQLYTLCPPPADNSSSASSSRSSSGVNSSSNLGGSSSSSSAGNQQRGLVKCCVKRQWAPGKKGSKLHSFLLFQDADDASVINSSTSGKFLMAAVQGSKQRYTLHLDRAMTGRPMAVLSSSVMRTAYKLVPHAGGWLAAELKHHRQHQGGHYSAGQSTACSCGYQNGVQKAVAAGAGEAAAPCAPLAAACCCNCGCVSSAEPIAPGSAASEASSLPLAQVQYKVRVRGMMLPRRMTIEVPCPPQLRQQQQQQQGKNVPHYVTRGADAGSRATMVAIAEAGAPALGGGEMDDVPVAGEDAQCGATTLSDHGEGVEVFLGIKGASHGGQGWEDSAKPGAIDQPPCQQRVQLQGGDGDSGVGGVVVSRSGGGRGSDGSGGGSPVNRASVAGCGLSPKHKPRFPSFGQQHQQQQQQRQQQQCSVDLGFDKPLVLVNKSPHWNETLNCWCLNFRGRVKLASVKNFQLVQDQQGGGDQQEGSAGAWEGEAAAAWRGAAGVGGSISSSSGSAVMMQSGKVDTDLYTLDYDPCVFTAVQAFAIALTTFENKMLL